MIGFTLHRQSLFIVFLIVFIGGLVDANVQRRTPIVEAFEKNKDTVVSILGKRDISTRDEMYNWILEDFPFFQQRNLRPSLGSGFIIHPRGYIVTNAHVIKNATDITVILADAKEYKGKVVAMDEGIDLALVKIDAPGSLPTVTLGDSDDLLIGETVLAIGNPFGYSQTLTDGIISAIHRKVLLDERQGPLDLIQISAPINPGNSGGPLLNINGEVIGINNAIRKAAEGIGFSIPINRLRESAGRMVNVERLYRLNFGADVIDAWTEPANASDQKPDDSSSSRQSRGALVRYVRSESPAAEAGFQVGDVVTAIDTTAVLSALEFQLELLEHNPGERITFTVLRDGKPATPISLEVTLAQRERPDAKTLSQQRLGLEVQAITTELKRQYGNLPGDIGSVVVMSVEKYSPAYNAGIKPGDVIVAVNAEAIRNMDDLGLALEPVGAGDLMQMTVHRAERLGPIMQYYIQEFTLRTRPEENNEDGKIKL
ncbi:MAG: trypsin-like peptidase domain-containing protein [Sedimentisphaerales bacterium]|nr:trypsin-like peptidase domain-containing protein [Sedimentisphaerales bacterium]